MLIRKYFCSVCMHRKQIINYNSNVIGVIIEKNGKKGYIPCALSSIIIDYEYSWMDDDIWGNFKDTLDFLNFVYEDNKKVIPCKPLMKVFEDEYIIGLITETNQFIAINEPELNTFNDNLESIKDAATRGFHVQSTVLSGTKDLLLSRVNAFKEGCEILGEKGKLLKLSMQRMAYLAKDDNDAKEKIQKKM